MGDEISSLAKNSSSVENGHSSTIESLLGRLQHLEEQMSTFNNDISSRTSALEKDLETSLIVSEKRAKRLDELYREASAENEALYEKFNTELGKVVKEFRTGNGQGALEAQLKSSLEELSLAKKENLRLKREVGGLKAVKSDIIEVIQPTREIVEILDA